MGIDISLGVNKGWGRKGGVSEAREDLTCQLKLSEGVEQPGKSKCVKTVLIIISICYT